MTAGMANQVGIRSEPISVQGQRDSVTRDFTHVLTFLSGPNGTIPIPQMSDAQKAVLELPESRFYNVFQSPICLPSQTAGLSEKDLCSPVAQIDKIYQMKIAGYHQRLGVCSEKDTQTWENYYTRDLFSRSFDYIISLGWSWHQIQVDGSAARISWLSEVSALEQERLQNMKRDIRLICEAAFADVKKDASYNECSPAFSKLTQLVKIYHSEFPEEGALIINEENIDDYLAQLTGSQLRHRRGTSQEREG